MEASTSPAKRDVSFVANDGTPISAWIAGDGPIVVLCHGWSGSQQSFRLQSALAAQHRCTVVTYDHRFHGSSGKPDHGFHVFRLAMDLRELLEAMHLNDVVLVGTSMGAAVIWAYIELFGQDKISKGVFVDQAPLQNRTNDWSLGSKGCYDADSLANLQQALQEDMSAFADDNLECCASLPIDAELAAVLKEETMRCSPSHLGKLMADHTQLDWRPVLRRITMPCLNCIGCHSGVFPVEGCEEVSRLITGCKTAYFSNANHWLYLEEPQKFNALLADFVHDRVKDDVIRL